MFPIEMQIYTGFSSAVFLIFSWFLQTWAQDMNFLLVILVRNGGCWDDCY